MGIKNGAKLIIIIVGVFCFVENCASEKINYEKRFLMPGKPYNATLDYNSKLCIYCYRGVQKHLFHMWETVFVAINLEPNEYELYKGSSPEDVLHSYQNEKSLWTNKLFSWKYNKIELDPFTLNCIGVDTVNDHKVEVNVIRIDFWRVIRLGTGVLLFLAAPNLSANPLFYYICGIALGVITSIFIALYLLSKLIPKKPTVYAFFIGGWAIAIYLFQLIWENIRIIATNYYAHALIYIFATGFISFVLCYRFGPVTDPRSKNLMKWTMQVVSLFLVFYSSRCQEASLLFVVLLILYYNFSKQWFSFFFTYWRRTFPPKVTFLTEDEYYEQGARETIKALNNLRQYCSSRECNQWKTVLSLHNPIRFAQFVEGRSHLEDFEVLANESLTYKNSHILTDDSDSSEDDYDL